MSLVRLVSLVILAVSPVLLAAPVPIDGLLGSDLNNPIGVLKGDIPISNIPDLGDTISGNVLKQRWNDVSNVGENIVNYSYNIANRDSIDPESHVQNDVTPAQESTSVVNVPYEADGNGDHNKVLKGDSVNSKRLATSDSVDGVEQQLDSTISHVVGDVPGLPVVTLRDNISALDHAPIVNKNVDNHNRVGRDTIDPELPVHNNVAPPMDSENTPSAVRLPYEANGNGDHNKEFDGDSVNAKRPQAGHEDWDSSHPGPNFVDATQTPP